MRNSQNKLATLAALAGLSQQLGAGPRQDAENAARDQQGRVAQALQLLGLQQTGQNQQQEAAFHQQQLGLEGQHYADEATRNTNQQQEAAATNEKGIQLQVLRELMANHVPGQAMDPTALQFMQKLAPDLVPIVQHQHDAEVQNQISQTLPNVQGLYDKGGANLPGLLGHMEQSTQPEVWNGLPWNQLNAGLKPPEPSIWSRMFGSGGQQQMQAPQQQQSQPPAAPSQSATASQFVQHPSGPNSFVFDLPGYLNSGAAGTNPLRNAGDSLQGGALGGTAFQKWLSSFGQQAAQPNPQQRQQALQTVSQ